MFHARQEQTNQTYGWRGTASPAPATPLWRAWRWAFLERLGVLVLELCSKAVSSCDSPDDVATRDGCFILFLLLFCLTLHPLLEEACLGPS